MYYYNHNKNSRYRNKRYLGQNTFKFKQVTQRKQKNNNYVLYKDIAYFAKNIMRSCNSDDYNNYYLPLWQNIKKYLGQINSASLRLNVNLKNPLALIIFILVYLTQQVETMNNSTTSVTNTIEQIPNDYICIRKTIADIYDSCGPKQKEIIDYGVCNARDYLKEKIIKKPPKGKNKCPTAFFWDKNKESKICDYLLNQPEVTVKIGNSIEQRNYIDSITDGRLEKSGISPTDVLKGALFTTNEDKCLRTLVLLKKNKLLNKNNLSLDEKITSFAHDSDIYHEVMGHLTIQSFNFLEAKKCTGTPYTDAQSELKFKLASDDFFAQVLPLIDNNVEPLTKKRKTISEYINKLFKNNTKLEQYMIPGLVPTGYISQDKLSVIKNLVETYDPWKQFGKIFNRPVFKIFPKFNCKFYYNVDTHKYNTVLTADKTEDTLGLAIFGILHRNVLEGKRARENCADKKCATKIINQEFIAYLLQYLPVQAIMSISGKMGAIVKQYRNEFLFK